MNKNSEKCMHTFAELQSLCNHLCREKKDLTGAKRWVWFNSCFYLNILTLNVWKLIKYWIIMTYFRNFSSSQTILSSYSTFNQYFRHNQCFFSDNSPIVWSWLYSSNSWWTSPSSLWIHSRRMVISRLVVGTRLQLEWSFTVFLLLYFSPQVHILL